MNACPPGESLELLISGRLDGAEASGIEAHVEHCPACQQRLEALTPAIGPPAEPARAGAPTDDRTAIDQLIDRRPLLMHRDGGTKAGDGHRTVPPPDTEGDAPRAASLPTVEGFEIIREVGRGGMGIVYEATELALGRRVALKVLPPMSASPNSAARFRREARAAGRLHHTNIVPIFGVGERGGLLYYAMQFIEGEGLDRLIDRLRTGQAAPATRPGETAPLTPSSGTARLAHARHVARIGLQVTEALEYAHNAGFLHRDIKPSNILLDPSGTAWVADFGLAKGAGADETLTHTGDIVGTLRYMPPERFAGRSDARGDVYALGATLYEFLTLRPVFDDHDRTRLIERVLEADPVAPRQLDRRVPRDLETIVLKAMAKDPAGRYATAGLMAEDLRRFLEGRPITARRVGARERLVRWARRRPLMACLCAAVTLLAVSLLGLGGWSYTRINRALRVEAATRAEMERLSADLLLDRGIELAEDGQVGRGLFWMLRSLDVAPAGDERPRRAARANLAAWQEQAIVPTLIRPNDSPVDAMALAPDGRTAVTGHRDGTIRSWDLSSGALLGSARAHAGSAFCVSFRPDGRAFATSGHYVDPTARLWDARTLEPIGAPMRHEPGSEVHHGFRPDGTVLATYSPEDGTVRLWDATTGRPSHPPLSHPGVVFVAFSPDGARLATVGRNREARLWDAATGRALGPPLPHHRSVVWGVTFSPDGRRLATVDGDFQVQASDARVEGRVRLWDAATGRLLAVGPAVRPGLWTVVFHPDGRTLVAAGFNGFAHLYDAETAEPLGAPMSHTEWVRQVVFSPDGRLILTASEDGTARLFDAESGRPLGSIMEHGDCVEAAGFGAGARTIVTASRDGSLRTWDATAADPRGRPLLQPPGVQTAELSPDGRLVATASFDGTARLYDAADGQPVGPPLLHSARVRAARFRPDGRVLATAGDDEAVRLWDVATGQPIGPPLRHGHWVVNLRFSPDGRKLLAGRVEGVARLWDLDTSRPIGGELAHPSRIPGHDVWSVAFTPDGRTAITGNGDGTVGFWDATTGGRIGDFLKLAADVRQFLFEPTARTVLVLAGDRVHAVDLALRREVAAPFGDRILAMALSPDGRSLLTGDAAKTSRLWDWAGRRPTGPPMRHDGAVVGVAFSPDGALAATVTTAGRIRFWDAAISKPVGPALQHPAWITRFGGDDRQPLVFGALGALFVTAGDSAVLWPGPAVSPEDRDRLAARIPVLSGFRADASGELVRLTPEDWSRALDVRPGEPGREPADDPLARHDRIAAHCEQFGPSSAALWHLDRLLAQRPDDWSLRLRRARIRFRLGDRAGAESDEARAIAGGPPDRVGAARAHRWQDLAEAAEAGERWMEAVDCLTGLIGVIRSNASLHLRRAEASAHLGRWAVAADDLETTHALNPPDFAWLGRSFLRRARTGAWAGDPADPERLVMYHLGAGDLDGYRACCARLRRQVPRDSDPALALYLVSLVSRGPGGSEDPAETARRAEEALAALPGEHALAARRYLGAALFRAGRDAEAIRRLEPDDPRDTAGGRAWDWAFLAMAHHRLGHDRQAREFLERLRAARPRPGPSRYLDELELEVLRREAEAVVRLDPDFPADPFARAEPAHTRPPGLTADHRFNFFSSSTTASSMASSRTFW